ncbi:MAG: hypothetical protein FJ333_03035 [Sphingomonadales bacterium]|nr:hypothetical protein [Sphingomonadales bacterium]
MKGGKSYFYTALSAFLVLRAFAYSYFSGNYTDSDQCVLWQMAADVAQFDFRTPFYYGQHYSSGLEAWLAAPFIWLGLPVYRAVPLTTALMSTLPWLWMAQLSIKKYKHFRNATALLFLSLLFPVEWLQTTYLSRGFMQSVFLISLATRLVSNSSLRSNLAIFLVGWGLLQNVNGLLMLPAVFPFWRDAMGDDLAHRNISKLLLKSLPSLAFLVCTYLLLNHFKLSHPETKIHPTVELNQSWQALWNNLRNINALFQHTYPTDFAIIGITIIAGITYFLFKPTSNLDKAIYLSAILLPFGLFGIEKIGDGTENIFFGYGRYFLAIPFSWGFVWAHNEIKIPKFRDILPPKWLFSILCLLGTGLYSYQFWDKTSLNKFGNSYIPVMVYPMNQIKQDAEALSQLCETDTIGAIVVLGHFILDCGSMGYPLVADFPPTSHLYLNDTTPEVFKIDRPIPIIRPKFERRTWLLQELKQLQYVPQKVAVMEVWKNKSWADSLQIPYTMADVRGPVYIFRTGNLSLTDFVKKMVNPSETEVPLPTSQ